jgi:hypothetical protein
MNRSLSLFFALCMTLYIAVFFAVPVRAGDGHDDELLVDTPADDLLIEDSFKDTDLPDAAIPGADLPADESEVALPAGSEAESGAGLDSASDGKPLETGFSYTLVPGEGVSQYTLTFSGAGTLTAETVKAALRAAKADIPAARITAVVVEPGVTAIGNAAFLLNYSITSVTLPEGLTEIGQKAFYCCTGLASVELPASVQTIGANAFAGCTRLSSVALPASLTALEEGAFSNCIRLVSVTFPNGLPAIGSRAFWGCTSLAAVALPGTLAEIGEGAFYACSRLASLTLPADAALGEDAFGGCDALAQISLCAGTASEAALRARLADAGLKQAATVQIEWSGTSMPVTLSEGETPLAALPFTLSAGTDALAGLAAGGAVITLSAAGIAFFSDSARITQAVQRLSDAQTALTRLLRPSATLTHAA